MTASPIEAAARAEGRERWRNIVLLASCQALFMTATSGMIAAAALVGFGLADDKSLATLPISLQFVAIMAATAPASLLMRRIGRRDGFTVGALFGVAGALIAAKGLFEGSFALVCLGHFLVGVFNGFAQFYRFAAADAASDAQKSKAISLVMAGGVVASVGPLLASQVKDLFAPVDFAGIYVCIAGLYVATLVILRFVTIPRPSAEERAAKGRPLLAIMRQPVFIVAVLAALVSYATMSVVMTSIPLAMKVCGLSFFDTAQVIQWHVFGMFAPSFFTGHLIRRFGVRNVMLAGAAIEALCVLVNVTDESLASFWIGGVLLGVGWNFLFVGATTLVTSAYAPAEKAKTQAANDFLVFSSVAVASLVSGVLHEAIGFAMMNYAALPLLAVTAIAVVALGRHYRNAPRAA
ncbi:MAG: MFS transporter [Alphaproteobacteria bacterium]